MLVAVVALLTVCLVPPVPGPMVAPFVGPVCAYCAGHRTVDFAANVGDVVIAPLAGRIVFAGWVVDQSFVTIEVQPDDRQPVTSWAIATEKILITLGNVAIADNLTADRRVRAGDPIGRAQGLVRLSMREVLVGGQAQYRDPTPFLGRHRYRMRLLPNSLIGGRARRPTLECRRSLVGDMG